MEKQLSLWRTSSTPVFGSLDISNSVLSIYTLQGWEQHQMDLKNPTQTMIPVLISGTRMMVRLCFALPPELKGGHKPEKKHTDISIINNVITLPPYISEGRANIETRFGRRDEISADNRRFYNHLCLSDEGRIPDIIVYTCENYTHKAMEKLLPSRSNRIAQVLLYEGNRLAFYNKNECGIKNSGVDQVPLMERDYVYRTLFGKPFAE